MVRRSSRKAVSSSTANLYLSKAAKFLVGAEQMLESKNAEAAALLAIHCTISSCDALTAKFLSCKHSGLNHQDIANLLGELPFQDKQELKNKRMQVRHVLTLKTNVEYDDKPVRIPTAKKIITEANRIFNWAGKHVS